MKFRGNTEGLPMQNSTGFSENRHFFKTNGRGVAYSIVPQTSFRRLFLKTDSGNEYSPETAAENLLNSAQKVLEQENALGNALDATIFLTDMKYKQLIREKMYDSFGVNLPAVTYVPQTNCGGVLFSMELQAVSGDRKNFKIQRLEEQTVRLDYHDLSVVYCADILPNRSPVGVYDRSVNAFQNLNALLSSADYDMTQLYRVWIHQGHIVAPVGDTQRYKELNRARADVFGKKRFLPNFLTFEFRGVAYPASTGIGADDYDVVMSAQAVATQRKNLIVTPLENPDQTSAFDYGEVYSPKSPKFARAMAFVDGSDAMIFVSGTASITDSESRHINQPVRQTEQTLDNIAALISGQNLEKYGIDGFSTTLNDLASLRVYIKNTEDYPAVREYCERRLGPTPAIYTHADVCRPELLVEIEGIAVPQKIS
ncbi:MAG: hypothetical protein LBQ54_07245 [Planctomycetaceae bacterium]|jgi:enamine deaminase RidA (YjgF/YER057c/UK114 family)|nr:hypothetical protein [Planctomycetaceae bacterium]